MCSRFLELWRMNAGHLLFAFAAGAMLPIQFGINVSSRAGSRALSAPCSSPSSSARLRF